MAYPTIELREAMYETLREGVAGGTLELLSAANQVLAIFELTSTAGEVAVSGSDVVWTLEFEANETAGETAAGVGTNATKAQIKNAGGNVRITAMTVSHSSGSGDIKLINTSISAGQEASISSATITWPNPGA